MICGGSLGSLLFCGDCGTLLDVPKADEGTVNCEQCGHEEPASCMWYFGSRLYTRYTLTFLNPATAYENIEITTRSHPDAFPSALRQKRKTQTKTHEATEGLLKVYVECFDERHTVLTVAVCRSRRNAQSADTWKPSQKRYRCVVFKMLIFVVVNGRLSDAERGRGVDYPVHSTCLCATPYQFLFRS